MSLQDHLKNFNTNHLYDYNLIESPIESFFVQHITKFLKPDTRIELQYLMKTISGNFRADVALINGNKVVLLECDGEEFHSKNDWYDEWRDSLILAEGRASAIYRIKGKDIYHNTYRVLSILGEFDNDLFDTTNMTRISNELIYQEEQKKVIRYEYTNEFGKIFPSRVEVIRKDLQRDFDRFYFHYILHSLVYRGNSIRELISIMSKRGSTLKELTVLFNNKKPTAMINPDKPLLKQLIHQIRNAN